MFRTSIEELHYPFHISHEDKLLALGSCFAEEIGGRLKSGKFDILVNPFGTIFNPLSLFELLEMSLERSAMLEEACVKRDGSFYNFKLHSSFRNKDKSGLLTQIEHQLDKVKAQITEAHTLLITFGTAWIYQKTDDQMLVANCHKLPQKLFRKRMLSVEEIVSGFFSLKESIQSINSNLQIVLTVSPVRHTRESLSFNSASKSALRLACHYLSDMAEDVHYFPSYEMVLDDLRDYRFYEKDMIHPNEQAVDYIWDKFSKCFFNSNTQQLVHQWQKVRQALEHKPFEAGGAKHQKFLRKTLDKLTLLGEQLDVRSETETLKKQIRPND